nr:cryptochrome-2 [Mirounga angustirostris]
MAAAVVTAVAAAQASAAGVDGASSVHWFRKGLRLHDNPALLAAVRGARCVRCVYILDPWFAASSSVGINRWRSTMPVPWGCSLQRPGLSFLRLLFLLQAWVANYERPRMNANSLLASPTGLSPYLRFGCLSSRLFYYRLWDLYKKVKRNSTPPLSLFGQLLWREFFYTAATNNPRFDRMEGNPICIQIPWDRNPEALAKWAEGKTGFPWIDAIMTQLRQEGWIHHLARHAVACFLTRGDLWVSWESGVRVFDELLLDADFSVNAGSWMWLSCSAFFQQFFHCYCPVGFGRRTDPSGDYIRRYLPILKGFPSRYIYEPWNAPESIQKAAKCIIGVDYPRPIVNHAETSRLNIERMKQIYQQLSRYRGLCLLASVPSCVEDLSNPVAEPSSGQTGSMSSAGPRTLPSGPASPKRKLEAAEEPPGEELSKRARVAEVPAPELPSRDV